MRKILLTIVLFSASILTYGQVENRPTFSKEAGVVQNTSSTEIKTVELLKFRKPLATDTKWKTKVVNVHSPKEYSPEVAEQKRKKDSLKLTAILGIGNDGGNTRRAFDPKIGVNFEGNELTKVTPPDNAIAVSTDGYVVAVDNYTIEYYKTDGTILLSRETHADFFNDNTLTGSIFDPRVIYDPIEDKFIYVILHGSTPSTSKVLVSFSKTSNPSDGWYIYTFDIATIMNNNGTWFDYPSIGISTNELFITGNMFKPNGNNNTFDQSIMLQIEKAKGFTGGSPTYSTWKNIKAANNTNAFTVKPLSFGHNSSYGPGIYLVSNYSGGSSNQGNVFVYDLTDDIASGKAELKSYQFNISGGYDIAGDASQKGTTDKIKTGNCRIQRGFYLDGILHFVFNAEYASGYSGINYCRVDIANSTIKSKSYGLTGYDYAFPSIASFSSEKTDKSVLIHFLRTGSNTYPETRIMTYDDEMNASNSVLVKAGETYVSIISGSERWGDYSGIARRYGTAQPEIWVSGCYGVADRNNHGFNAWIAQIGPAFGVGIEEAVKPTVKTSIYPNPVEDLFEMEIDMPASGKVEISILDITGKVVKVLFKDKLKSGVNDLRFNKNALNTGTYIIQVLGDNIKTNTKIIIE